MKTKWSLAVLVCICMLSMIGNAPVPGLAQGPDTQIDVGPQSVVSTGFTYQGQLKQSSAPFSGNCDFQFTLWDAPTAGTQVTGAVSKPNVAVSRGVFTVPDISFGVSSNPMYYSFSGAASRRGGVNQWRRSGRQDIPPAAARPAPSPARVECSA